ncbi:MAG: hypothetical protein ACP5IE_10195 [Infirmifilum sp.]
MFNFGFGLSNQPSLSQYIYNLIKNEWEPDWSLSEEAAYRDDLIEFLDKKLNKAHLITKEDGRHLADIGIDEKIGIELKLNLSGKKEVDRLIGQVQGYLDDYNAILIVLLGKTSPETVRNVNFRLKKLYVQPDPLFGNLFRPAQAKQIYLIVKSPISTSTPKSKGLTNK